MSSTTMVLPLNQLSANSDNMRMWKSGDRMGQEELGKIASGVNIQTLPHMKSRPKYRTFVLSRSLQEKAVLGIWRLLYCGLL